MIDDHNLFRKKLLLVKMFIFEITYFIYKILFKNRDAQKWVRFDLG